MGYENHPAVHFIGELDSLNVLGVFNSMCLPDMSAYFLSIDDQKFRVDPLFFIAYSEDT